MQNKIYLYCISTKIFVVNIVVKLELHLKFRSEVLAELNSILSVFTSRAQRNWAGVLESWTSAFDSVKQMVLSWQ